MPNITAVKASARAKNKNKNRPTFANRVSSNREKRKSNAVKAEQERRRRAAGDDDKEKVEWRKIKNITKLENGANSMERYWQNVNESDFPESDWLKILANWRLSSTYDRYIHHFKSKLDYWFRQQLALGTKPTFENFKDFLVSLRIENPESLNIVPQLLAIDPKLLVIDQKLTFLSEIEVDVDNKYKNYMNIRRMVTPVLSIKEEAEKENAVCRSNINRFIEIVKDAKTKLQSNCTAFIDLIERGGVKLEFPHYWKKKDSDLLEYAKILLAGKTTRYDKFEKDRLKEFFKFNISIKVSEVEKDEIKKLLGPKELILLHKDRVTLKNALKDIRADELQSYEMPQTTHFYHEEKDENGVVELYLDYQVDKFFTIKPSPILGTFVIQFSEFDGMDNNDVLVTPETYDYKWICQKYSTDEGVISGISERFRNIYILRRLIIDFFIRIIDNVSTYALTETKSSTISETIGVITLKTMEYIRTVGPEKQQEILLDAIYKQVWGYKQIGGVAVLGIYDFICNNLNKEINGDVDNEIRENRKNIGKLLSMANFKNDIENKIAGHFKHVSFANAEAAREKSGGSRRAKNRRRKRSTRRN